METQKIPWERGLTDLNILEMSLEDAVYLSVSDHLRALLCLSSLTASLLFVAGLCMQICLTHL